MKLNFRTTAFAAAIAAALTLAACGGGSTELAEANSKIKQQGATIADQAKALSSLSSGKENAEKLLAVEKARAASLSARLADTNRALQKTQIANSHLADQVKGASRVAGTAVDHAHAKGVNFGKATADKLAMKKP